MASKAENQPGATQTIAVVRERDDDLASIALTWFVEVTALAAAITFGIFSALPWTAAENAKEQANTANLVALAALCGNIAAQVRPWRRGVIIHSLHSGRTAGQWIQH